MSFNNNFSPFQINNPITGIFGSGNVQVYGLGLTGTFTVPAGVTAVRVRMWGGGGGSAGGGGGFALKIITGLSPAATIAVTVGAAGGGAGGTSSFGAYVSATGGASGGAGGQVLAVTLIQLVARVMVQVQAVLLHYLVMAQVDLNRGLVVVAVRIT